MTTKTISFDDLEQRDFDALQLHSRKVGAPIGDVQCDLRKAPWAKLHSIRSAVKKTASATLKHLETAANDADIGLVERNHDVLMTVIDAVQEEIDLRDAHGQRDPLTPDQMGLNRPVEAVGATHAAGFAPGDAPYIGHRSGWSDKDGREIRVAGPKERLSEGAEYRGPPLGAILRAMVTGPRTDLEKRVLSEGTTTAGGYTVPTPLATFFIDRLRSASVCVRAGARTVPMDSKTLNIAKLTGAATVGWRAEGASVANGDPTFGEVTLTAKSLMGMVIVSRELLADSVNISAMLENEFVRQTGLAFDQGLLFGTGSSNDPVGLTNMGSLATVSMGTNGATLASSGGYDKLVDSVYAIQAANAGDPNAMIFHPRTGASLAKLKDGNGRNLEPPQMIANIAPLPTTSVSIAQTQGSASTASSIIFGDFTRMLIGVRQQLEIRLIDQLHADNNEVGFYWGLRGDVQVEHIEAFSELVGILP